MFKFIIGAICFWCMLPFIAGLFSIFVPIAVIYIVCMGIGKLFDGQ